MRQPAPRRRRVVLAIVSAIIPIAALTTVMALPGPASAAVPAPPAGWSTVFSDDFTGAAGTGLNTANWLYDTGTSYPGGAGNWGTGEVESVTNSTANVFQDGNGHLVIKPINNGGAWTSGRVETQRTDFAAPVGGQMEITASIEQPNPGNGLGYWPAFWAMGAAARPVGATNWPSIGELDILEDVNALSEVSHTFHCGVDPGGPCNETTGIGSGLLSCGGCQTAYHTYSVIVDRTHPGAEQLRFYTDGALQLTVNQSQFDATTWANAVDHGFFIILNVAIGGAYPNAICGCSSPSAATSSGAGMSVDYVAVYETNGASTSPSPSASASRSSSPSPSPSASSSGGGGTGGGTSCTTTATSNISADCFGASQGSISVGAAAGDTSPAGVDGNQAAQLINGDWLEYKNVNFGTGSSQFDARVASGAAGGVSGLVDVVLDNPNNSPIGSFAVANTGGWSSWTTVPANISTVTGTHNVYLKFVSGAGGNPPYVSLHYFSFPAH
jgi:hypothetical protein